MTSPQRLLTSMSEEALTQACTRFTVLHPFLEVGVSLPRVATATGIPLRTLRRWVQRYQGCGLAGLTRKPRADAGVRRRLHADLVTLIEGLALQRPAPSEVHSVPAAVPQVFHVVHWRCPGHNQ